MKRGLLCVSSDASFIALKDIIEGNYSSGQKMNWITPFNYCIFYSPKVVPKQNFKPSVLTSLYSSVLN